MGNARIKLTNRPEADSPDGSQQGPTLVRAHREQQRHVSEPPVHAVDWEVVCILLSVAVLLTLQEYLLVRGNYHYAVELVGRCLPRALSHRWLAWATDSANQEIVRNGMWALGQITLYTAIPLGVIASIGRRPLADYGVKWRGATRGWQLYVLMFLTMLPAIWLASYRTSFQETYPFYRLQPGEALWPRFFVWELLYAMQFVALEFFFRGYLLHGTRRRFGPYAILVMTIPYCMIHFGKPMLETFGAIGAGVALGFMSLKTRSIWLGAAIHIAVAWTMDALALIR